MIQRLWEAEKAAWRAWWRVLRPEPFQMVDVFHDPTDPGPAPPSDAVLFRVEAVVGDILGVLYEGHSGGDARRTIERLRENSSVEHWWAFRDGVPWCDSRRE